MIQQPLKQEKSTNIYYLNEFKFKKPFFKKPMKITVDHPLNDTYIMLKNIVYKEKQILALHTEKDPCTIFLVEAKIDQGQLKHISTVPDEHLLDISSLIELDN